MKIFICYRSIDKTEGDKVIQDLLSDSENSIAVLTETQHSNNWQDQVEEKIQESDFVVFLIGDNTFNSEQIKWEYNKAKKLNKQIIGIRLTNSLKQSTLTCQGFQVFANSKQATSYLNKTYTIDRQLKIEQYKIMVSSTEKVTDSRMKINNLFFTITSSILSVTFVLGKTYSFAPLSVFAMIILTLLALVTSFFWEKLINSYGKLNKGKFKLIHKIEKELRTNMFEEEWKILTKEIKYEPNSQTEIKIVQRFRYCIYLILLTEGAWLLAKKYGTSFNTNLFF